MYVAKFDLHITSTYDETEGPMAFRETSVSLVYKKCFTFPSIKSKVGANFSPSAAVVQ